MSSLTNLLKLFKWDTKTDSSQKFDIDKALNENWDKIDAGIENAQKTTITTAIAEEITVTDCAGVNAKLDIKSGKTIQNGTPTPTTPIEIRNVGDNINILDLNVCTFINCINNKDGTIKSNINNANYCSISTTSLNQFLINNRGKNITFSFKGIKENTYSSIIIYGTRSDSDIKYLQASGYENTTINILNTFTEITKIELRFNTKNSSYTDTTTVISNLKLEQGSISTPYTPYNCGSIDFTLKNQDNSKNRIVSFPLEEGQVLHDGDYLASDGIHTIKNINTYVGNEGWVITEIKDTSALFYIDVSNAKGDPNELVLSNYFKFDNTVYNGSKGKQGLYILSNKKLVIRAPFVTLDEWKAWLSEKNVEGLPLKIEYKLETEQVIPYTAEQEKVYYELQHLLIYEGYTNISCVNEIKPDIQLTYYYNNLLNKSYAKRFDELEEKIRKLGG